ncbi:hypothetical protein Pmani_030403 [Petrolisthes manimaculis]|uniref:BRICHOS domain-containing protein n=1 Tax=Petrolisthes manimaculis TaxID=1843537 RepID=A0AAE1TVZ3_9EUCA|nr:hypothetical protein Pmani_030403 [Petrolisthes manimaculis]
MWAWIVFTLIGSTYASVVAEEKVVTVLYNDPSVSDPVKLEVKVNERADTITYHMLPEGSMADVETFEDYTTGFAASRDTEEEGCFIRRLPRTLKEEVRGLEQATETGPQQYSGSLDLLALTLGEEEEVMVGERILDFCGDYQMYKLVAEDENDLETANGDNNNDKDTPAEELRFFFSFRRRCRLFSFFFSCYNFTCTSSTGQSLVFPFFWFFGFNG